MLVWADIEGLGVGFYLIDDRDGTLERIGKGVLTEDGHCSFSSDGRWILTDAYPGPDNARPLMVYDWRSNRLEVLGRFHSPPELRGEIRCDLHPRWNAKGDQVCFDSTHEGTRQLYVMELDEAGKQRPAFRA